MLRLVLVKDDLPTSSCVSLGQDVSQLFTVASEALVSERLMEVIRGKDGASAAKLVSVKAKHRVSLRYLRLLNLEICFSTPASSNF